MKRTIGPLQVLKFFKYSIFSLFFISASYANQNSLSEIEDLDTFKEFALEKEGNYYLKFLIERSTQKIHFINTKRYSFHHDFVQTIYPRLNLNDFNNSTYFTLDRLFIAGTLTYHSSLKALTFEFWEGDRIKERMIQSVYSLLGKHLYHTNLAFHPNSINQEEMAKKLSDAGIKILSSQKIYEAIPFKVYNSGKSVGRLRVLDVEDDPDSMYFDRQDIVLLHRMPSDITPVRGIIATKHTPPLSHVNLRAGPWGIPNMVLKEAYGKFKHLNGKMVFYSCDVSGYEIHKASRDEIDSFESSVTRPSPMKLAVDLNYKNLPSLGELGARDALKIGTKGSNLSELAQDSRLNVPTGFSVPFYYYDEFIKKNEIGKKIVSVLSGKKFSSDPSYRKLQLDKIKAWIKNANHTESFIGKLKEKLKEYDQNESFFHLKRIQFFYQSHFS